MGVVVVAVMRVVVCCSNGCGSSYSNGCGSSCSNGGVSSCSNGCGSMLQ